MIRCHARLLRLLVPALLTAAACFGGTRAAEVPVTAAAASRKAVPVPSQLPSRSHASADAFVRWVSNEYGFEPMADVESGWKAEKTTQLPPFRVAVGAVAAVSLTKPRPYFLVAEKGGEVVSYGPLALERAGPGTNEGVQVARLSVVMAGEDRIVWAEVLHTAVTTDGEDREDSTRLAFVFAVRDGKLRCVARRVPLTIVSKKDGAVVSESSIVVSFPRAGTMHVVRGKGEPTAEQAAWLGDVALE